MIDRKFVIILLLIFPVTVLGQKKIVLVDAFTRKPLQVFRVIDFNGHGIKIKNSWFLLPPGNSTDSVLISKNGYYPQTISVSYTRDTVFLIPMETEKLQPVIISIGKRHKKRVGFKRDMFQILSLSNFHDIIHEMNFPLEYHHRRIISLRFKTVPYTVSGGSKVIRLPGSRRRIERVDTSRVVVELFHDSMNESRLLYRSDTISLDYSRRKSIELNLGKAHV